MMQRMKAHTWERITRTRDELGEPIETRRTIGTAYCWISQAVTLPTNNNDVIMADCTDIGVTTAEVQKFDIIGGQWRVLATVPARNCRVLYMQRLNYGN